MTYRILILFCALTAAVTAQPTLTQETLTLDQAIIRVLENNPRLKIADFQSQAMAARMRQAVQPPADRVSVTLENFAGTDEHVGVRSIEATLSLSRTLELGDKAARRGDVVEGENRLLQSELDIDRLNLLADAAQRFLNVVADQERLNLIESAIELVNQTRSTVEQHIQAGNTAIVERHRVSIDVANHEIELEHHLHELENSRVSLASLWNMQAPDFGHAEADIYALGELPDFAVLTGLLDRNPELIQHLRAEDLARSRIRLMQSRSRPDLDVSAGLRYLGGSNDVAAMLWASIPLGTAARSRPGIEEAESLSSVEPLNLEQKKQELYATLFGFYQEMKHAREAITKLDTTIIPSAEQMRQEYEAGYRAGRYSLLELIQAQQVLHAARKQRLEMAASFHSRKIEIDRLTAAQLTQW